MLGLLSVLGIGIGLAKDACERNKPYYGTERDIFRNNPRALEQRRRTEEICNKVRREYEERTGQKAYW